MLTNVLVVAGIVLVVVLWIKRDVIVAKVKELVGPKA